MVETERVARRLPRELILWFVPPDGGAEDRVTAETSMGNGLRSGANHPGRFDDDTQTRAATGERDLSRHRSSDLPARRLRPSDARGRDRAVVGTIVKWSLDGPTASAGDRERRRHDHAAVCNVTERWLPRPRQALLACRRLEAAREHLAIGTRRTAKWT